MNPNKRFISTQKAQDKFYNVHKDCNVKCDDVDEYVNIIFCITHQGKGSNRPLGSFICVEKNELQLKAGGILQ